MATFTTTIIIPFLTILAIIPAPARLGGLRARDKR
jgi:hypothetical protein